MHNDDSGLDEAKQQTAQRPQHTQHKPTASGAGSVVMFFLVVGGMWTAIVHMLPSKAEVAAIKVAQAGESPEQTQARKTREADHKAMMEGIIVMKRL